MDEKSVVVRHGWSMAAANYFFVWPLGLAGAEEDELSALIFQKSEMKEKLKDN